MEEEAKFLGSALNFTPEWWTFVLMGIFALILGALAFGVPGWFSLFFGYFVAFMVIIYSIITLVQGLKSKEGAGASIALILLGILGIIVGLIVVANVVSAFLLTTFLIAFWMFMIAFTNIWMAFTGSAGVGYKILLAIAGIFAFIIAIYLMITPLLTTLVVMQVIGLFAMIWGIIMIVTGAANRGKPAAEIAAETSS